ncbi:zinc finger MYM-type protein 5-like isoform X2 [Oratosquilla oratoria]
MSMSKRKGGWERAQESKKKKQMQEDLLAKTHKLTSYFQVVDKDVGSSSGDLDDQSPISPPSDTVQSKVIGDDDESTATKEVQSSVSNEAVPNDVGLFGHITRNLREVCISMGTDHSRNLANDYPKTKREYSGVNRFLNPSAFTRVLPNGEVVSRDWLVYSPAKTCVFCFSCILFSSDRSIKLCTSGDNDWKNITQNLKSHETSTKHIDSVLTLAHRSAAAGRIDAEFHKNMIEQHKYWKNVLTHCVATIAFLYERGSNEINGSGNWQLFGNIGVD